MVDAIPDVGVDGTDQSLPDAAWRMLVTLPDRQRAVLVLRYLMDSDTGPESESANGIIAFSGMHTMIAHLDRLPELSC